MTTEAPTPLTNAAAIGFARILIDHEKHTTTELVEANFARTLERSLAAARKELAQHEAFLKELSDYSHKDRCETCYGAGCVGIPGAVCSSCDGAGKNRLALAFKWVKLEKELAQVIKERDEARAKLASLWEPTEK